MGAKQGSIAARLDARRRELGMSRRILAKRCGLKYSIVSDGLAGRSRLTMSRIDVLARELGMEFRVRRLGDSMAFRGQVYPAECLQLQESTDF